MGDPFIGASAERSSRFRQSQAETKLAAAKEILADELKEVGDDIPVAIFGFNVEARLIFEGIAGRRSEIQTTLDSVRAFGGTDIAVALNVAADYRQAHVTSGVPRIILISDGKSGKAEATRAARRCSELSIGIHFILIDPTEEGETFRREVVRPVGGTSETVASQSQLKEATERASKQYRQDQARAERFLKTADAQAEAVREEVRGRHRIQFTSGYASRIHPGKAYPLLVYVHLESMRAAVAERLAQAGSIFGELPRQSLAETNQLFPIGTNLEITPRISNLAVNPTQQTLTWLGEIEQVLFSVRYAGPRDVFATCSGFIDVTSSGLLVAQIPISLSLGDDQRPFQWEGKNAELISRVFASYAREDFPIVDACKAAYRALGIQLFVDKDELLAGQPWREVIRRSISNHNLFQLFWSKFSADSSEVANEWHLALEIAPQRTLNFLRPVYWLTPLVEPPGELKHLNFGFLDLNSFRIEQNRPATTEAPIAEHSSKALEVQFPIVEVVDCEASAVENLRSHLSRVVPFLEQLIGTRYYPPVTFLVDEHSVQALRAMTVPTKANSRDNHPNGLADQHVLHLLQSLALAFHVGELASPEQRHYDRRAEFFDATDSQRKAELHHVGVMTEYLFSGPVPKFLAGNANSLDQGRATLEDVLRDVRDRKCSGWNAKHLIESLLEVASPSDQALVHSIVTAADLEQLGSFNQAVSSAVAQRLFSTDLPRLATRYRVEIFFGRPDMTELRFKRTFPEYIRAFCDKWLSFVDVAVRKRGKDLVEIRFSVPESALAWLESVAPNVAIVRREQTTTPWGDGEPEACYDIHLQDYRICVDFLAKRLAERLAHGGTSLGEVLFPVIESTFGVFVPSGAASAQAQFEATLLRSNWPRQAALSGQDKILICLGAVDRLRAEMAKASMDETTAKELSRRFALAVLVHEHFHSALATGVDRNGHSPLGPQNPQDWKTAASLNESLAVWAERHHFRNDPEMLANIDNYIASGEYPSWPYRGAEIIEQFYQQGGLPTVRGWTHFLRDDPLNAQVEFDKRVSGRTTPRL